MNQSRTLQLVVLAVLLAATTAMSGCAAVEGIFKAGFWVGVVMVVIVVGVIFGIARGLRT